MLEILILILGSNKVAETAENKGQSPILWRLLFIASWFIGAFFSLVIAFAVTAGGPRGGLNLCAGFFAYLLGGVLGIAAVSVALAVWPEPPRERGYLDDYEEYQRTGRVRSYRDEPEGRRRPRRRPRDDEYEERPRRRYEEDDRPRRDDRYREDDRPSRRRDDPDDRPRRPRRDEDY